MEYTWQMRKLSLAMQMFWVNLIKRFRLDYYVLMDDEWPTRGRQYVDNM